MYRSGWSPESGPQVPFWYLRYEVVARPSVYGVIISTPYVYSVTIRDAIHKLLQVRCN